MKAIFKTCAAVLTGAAISLPALAADLPSIALDAAGQYRERARFPESSHLIADAVDPVRAARIPSRQRMAGPNGAAPALEVWADAIAVQPGRSVDLFARLDWLGTDAGVEGLQGLRLSQVSGWELSGELIADGSGRLARFDYADDGRGADALSGDGIYSARVPLDAAHAPALGTAQNVMVKVRALNAAGEERRALGGFQLSQPGAVLTGNYRQAVSDGNLLVLAEAEVLAPGRYHLSGSLSDRLGTPVATAQSATVAEPGTQWLALPFYGLIFHELGGAAGLTLGSVTLASTNGMPNALGAVQADAFALAAVPLDALTAQPFGDPALLDAAGRLEALVAVPEMPASRVGQSAGGLGLQQLR